MTRYAASVAAILTVCIVHATRSSPVKGPPHVWGAVPSGQTFRLGDTVKLDCPIRANPSPILEWSKDGDSIKPGWERYKPTNHGLRIKGVLLDDTGFFTCKGVNGFGSEQVTFHVQIIDPKAKATEAPPPLSIFSGSEPMAAPGWEEAAAEVNATRSVQRGPAAGAAPLLIETSQTPGRIWQLPLDSTLRLKCLAQGQPEPHLIWIKDGREIGDDRRKGRWELQVPRVGLEDSGTYTCLAVNPFGSMNASFIIQVVDRRPSKPEFVGANPQNVTVLEGSTARLQCRVTSDTSPFLQWLRRLQPLSPFDRQPDDQAQQPDGNGIISFDGWKYQVVRSGSPAYQADDGSYLDKLSLTDVTFNHAGVYICVATNSAGYNYRQATLAVLTETVGPLETSNSGSLPTAAVIGLPLGGVAVVLLIGCVVYYVRADRGGRRKDRQQLPGAALTPHQQRHDIINKDMGGVGVGVGVATPCLPPEHAHRLTLPPNNPPTYHPYSSGSYLHRHLLTPYMGSIQQQDMLLSYQPELVRMHNVINGRQSGRSLGLGGGGSLFRDTHNSNGSTWSNMYRPQPCGRASDRNPSLSSFAHHDSAESEHAYASVHNMNVNYAAFDYEDVRPNNSRRFVQRIDMV